MISRGQATVNSIEGLHARPAADFVRLVNLSGHAVTVTNEKGQLADGASILGVLSLGVKHGQTVTFEVEGPDSEGVLLTLIAVVSQKKQD